MSALQRDVQKVLCEDTYQQQSFFTKYAAIENIFVAGLFMKSFQ